MPKRTSGSVDTEVFDLTIDVCILISASKAKDTTRFKKPCKDLMERIADEDSNHFVALDKRISAQYNNRIPHGKYGRNWLGRVYSTRKYRVVTPVQTEKAVEERLRRERFGGKGYRDDIKYVEVARGTQCHILVSHDVHFLEAKSIIKKKPICVDVRSPQEALDLPCREK